MCYFSNFANLAFVECMKCFWSHIQLCFECRDKNTAYFSLWMHFVNLCTQNIKYVVWKYAVWFTPFAYAWLVSLVSECVTVQLQQGSLTMQFLATTKIYAPATHTCHCIVHSSIQKHGWINFPNITRQLDFWDFKKGTRGFSILLNGFGKRHGSPQCSLLCIAPVALWMKISLSWYTFNVTDRRFVQSTSFFLSCEASLFKMFSFSPINNPILNNCI